MGTINFGSVRGQNFAQEANYTAKLKTNKEAKVAVAHVISFGNITVLIVITDKHARMSF